MANIGHFIAGQVTHGAPGDGGETVAFAESVRSARVRAEVGGEAIRTAHVAGFARQSVCVGVSRVSHDLRYGVP